MEEYLNVNGEKSSSFTWILVLAEPRIFNKRKDCILFLSSVVIQHPWIRVKHFQESFYFDCFKTFRKKHMYFAGARSSETLKPQNDHITFSFIEKIISYLYYELHFLCISVSILLSLFVCVSVYACFSLSLSLSLSRSLSLHFFHCCPSVRLCDSLLSSLFLSVSVSTSHSLQPKVKELHTCIRI